MSVKPPAISFGSATLLVFNFFSFFDGDDNKYMYVCVGAFGFYACIAMFASVCVFFQECALWCSSTRDNRQAIFALTRMIYIHTFNYMRLYIYQIYGVWVSNYLCATHSKKWPRAREHSLFAFNLTRCVSAVAEGGRRAPLRYVWPLDFCVSIYQIQVRFILRETPMIG